ncbi:hypothetical protein DYBT9275_00544 [Dyadobacter sp. CECT 9275]|uniref:Methyltransferase domain-containing protein n=1 Tax=Dyadobacter helix TaxID=2822344 RepID=A0A916N2L1_9BACT|nr:class I SAM-dependent methyltransferase [Dyadobacter sp. CECT 9275]CAG4990509.1 hypothetical protein DYBT9275_00544 [Dyadobacter sp. CECT 9275]
MTLAWYHTYFQGLPQRAWKLHQDEAYTEFEVDFLRDVLELEPGKKVLDILAGYGRHALPLAAEGCLLTCVDISSEYCTELSTASSDNGLAIHVICDDVLEHDLAGEKFDAAYCLGNSFSFFPRKDLQKLIGKVAGHLKSGAHFAIHTQHLAESIFPDFQTRIWMPVTDEIVYLAQNEYNAAEGCIEAEQTFISGTEKVTHQARQYVYTLAELCGFFENAGFEVMGTFANIEADAFSLGDDQLYLLARKR